MKTKMMLATAVLGLAACSATAESPKYQVKVDLPDSDGSMIYITDYDTSAKLDSTIVANGVAMFNGTLEKPVLARLISDGERLGMFVLEPGTIEITEGNVKGSKLNDAINQMSEKMIAFRNEFQANPSDSLYEVISAKANAYTDSVFEANADNPVGYYLFVQQAYDMDRQELAAALEKYPQMKGYTRVQKVMDVFDRQEATAPGKKFTDFEITYDGTTHKLSDYVGKGNYVLVDFWASWCGPCRREAETLKKIYAEYAPKGLDIVGVAVWDEPDNTLQAIEDLQLPWKQVINGQTIPTDIYGILGIPCIILFAPDGTIVSRGLQGDALVASVAEAMGNVPASETPAE